MFPAALLSRLASFFSRSGRMRGSRGVGQGWERLAERRLRSAGYEILERNLRTPAGELDFVARQNGVLCFIEVKGRHGTGFGLPAEAVTQEKQRRIFRSAEAYLQSRRLSESACRFDVVSILEKKGELEVTILTDAFCGPPARRLRRR